MENSPLQDYIKMDTLAFTSTQRLNSRNYDLPTSSKIHPKKEKQTTQIINDINQPIKYFKTLRSIVKFKYYVKKMIDSVPSIRFKNLKQCHYQLIGDKSVSYFQDDQNEGEKLYNLLKKISKIKFVAYFNLFKLIPVIQPHSIGLFIWDSIQAITMLVLFFIIPIIISMKVQVYDMFDVKIIDICIIFQFLDMFISMNTGYYEKGIYQYDRTKILTHYFTQKLHLNILTNCSLILLEQFPIISIFFFYKVVTFIQILNKLEETFQLSWKNKNWIKLFKLMASMLFISHIFACIWLYETQVNEINENIGEENWMVFRNVYLSDLRTKYIMSLYFVVVTMATVGYGDVSPKNNNEFILCIFTMLFSCIVFAHLINSIGLIFQNMQEEENQIERNIQVINNFMRSKKISFNLQQQIREYLQYFWKEARKQHIDIELNIINQLSENLRDKLWMEANKIVLKDSPIFNKNFSEKFINQCVHLITENYFQPNQTIQTVFEQENDYNIYFLEKGQVEFFLDIIQKGNEKDTHSLKILQPGQVFGYYSFFTGLSESYKLKCRDFTQLLIIKRGKFLELLQEFPDDYEQFCYIKDQLIYGNSQLKIGQFCQSCGHYTHSFLTCPLIHPQMDTYKIIKSENRFSDTQNRRKFQKRQNRDRFHIMKNLEYIKDNINNFYQQNESYLYDQSWLMLTQSSLENSDISSIQEQNESNHKIEDLIDETQKQNESNIQQIPQKRRKESFQSNNSESDENSVSNEYKKNDQNSDYKYTIDKSEKVENSVEFQLIDYINLSIKGKEMQELNPFNNFDISPENSVQRKFKKNSSQNIIQKTQRDSKDTKIKTSIDYLAEIKDAKQKFRKLSIQSPQIAAQFKQEYKQLRRESKRIELGQFKLPSQKNMKSFEGIIEEDESPNQQIQKYKKSIIKVEQSLQRLQTLFDPTLNDPVTNNDKGLVNRIDFNRQKFQGLIQIANIISDQDMNQQKDSSPFLDLVQLQKSGQTIQHFFGIDELDVMKDFILYYPHYNYPNIIFKYNRSNSQLPQFQIISNLNKQRKLSKKRKLGQMLEQRGTLRQITQNSVQYDA